VEAPFAALPDLPSTRTAPETRRPSAGRRILHLASDDLLAYVCVNVQGSLAQWRFRNEAPQCGFGMPFRKAAASQHGGTTAFPNESCSANYCEPARPCSKPMALAQPSHSADSFAPCACWGSPRRSATSLPIYCYLPSRNDPSLPLELLRAHAERAGEPLWSGYSPLWHAS